jgi:hypothetical protein
MAADSKRKKFFLATLNALFERKTIKGFADRIKTFADLEPGLQETLRPYLDRTDPIRLMLLAPAQSVLSTRPDLKWLPKTLLPWEITPERTLVLTGRQLLVASTTRNAEGSREARLVGEKDLQPRPAPTHEPPQVVDIPISGILYLESGTVLLNSWLEIVWICDGRPERTRIVFNTVSRIFFEEMGGLIRQLIQQNSGIKLSQISGGGQGLERLQAMPYKFKSLIPLHLLLAGEQIQAAAFQPSIWRKKPPFFRTHVAARMALVRTGSHLILAQENLTSDEESYGLTAQFLPLRSVRCGSFQDSSDGPELVVTLSLGGMDLDLRRPLAPEARPALETVLQPWL